MLVGLGAKALTSLVLRSSMVAFVDVTSLLEDIDTSTPALIRDRCVLAFSLFDPHLLPRRDLVHSLVALPPYLVVGLTTLQPLGFCKHYLLSCARHQ